MSTHRASEQKVKLAAAMLTTVSVIVGAFSANAQNVTMPPQCASIRDHAQQAQCYTNWRIAQGEAQIRVNQAQVAENLAESDCSKRLVTIATDPVRRTRGQQLLAGKTVEQYGACNLLRALSNS